MDCGCVVACDYDKTLAVRYCPKHKAAFALYEACVAIISEGALTRTDPLKAMVTKAIAKAGA